MPTWFCTPLTCGQVGRSSHTGGSEELYHPDRVWYSIPGGCFLSLEDLEPWFNKWESKLTQLATWYLNSCHTNQTLYRNPTFQFFVRQGILVCCCFIFTYSVLQISIVSYVKWPATNLQTRRVNFPKSSNPKDLCLTKNQRGGSACTSELEFQEKRPSNSVPGLPAFDKSLQHPICLCTPQEPKTIYKEAERAAGLVPDFKIN